MRLITHLLRATAAVVWAGIILTGMISPLSLRASSGPVFQQAGNLLVMSNGNVVVQYNLTTGNAAFYWQNQEVISAFYSGISFSNGYVKGINYSNWTYAVTGSNQVAVSSQAAGWPAMKQYFTLDQSNSFLVRVDAVGTNATQVIGANWMGPVVVDATGGVDIGSYDDDRALAVPFDNDGFSTYNAMPINNSDDSHEVAAFYDNTTRQGLVVGAVTHDTWKTGIYFNGSNNNLDQMNVYGGDTSPWDTMGHGYVNSNTLSSPTMFVGFGPDWRAELEAFAAENTNFAPRLAWTNGVPFGWNSWGVIQQNINYNDALMVSDFFHTNLMLQGFTNNGTVYVNLDSYWDNLNNSQLQSFVNQCHAFGQKAGVYIGPFVWFGSADNSTNTYIEGSTNTYTYSQAILRNSSGNFESVDGGLALDPTHPGTQDRVHYYINLFTNAGFDYVKIDFLSHAALEGGHYAANTTTGMAAYNFGMQYLFNQIAGRMFISESIAPPFPYQYGHSRRIACDAENSLISNIAYTMNSVNYGWWLDDLYQFNDPDIMVFNGYGATTNENQSRLISGAVTGLYLDGDDLTSATGQQAADATLANAAINAVARVGRTFQPMEGNTGTGAANIYVRQGGDAWQVAVFNYSAVATNILVNLGRAGLPVGNYGVTNLWNGLGQAVSGSFTANLNAKQAQLFQLTPLAPGIGAPLVSGGQLIFNGSNGAPGGTYYVLATTNLAASAANWSVTATNNFDAYGNFTVTNSLNRVAGPEFYKIRVQ